MSLDVLKALTPEQQDLLAQDIADPVRFVRTFLRCNLTPIQEQILQALATHQRVAVKSCHASGKSYVASGAILHFLAAHTDCVVVSSAPTFAQLTRVLWNELKSHLDRSIYPFPEPTMTELRLGPKRYAVGVSTDDVTRAQGYHAEHSLWVLDEAPGCSDAIWEALEAARSAGDVRVLALGNPVVSSGKFYEIFANPDSGWHCITIDAFSTPNFEGLTLAQLLELPDEELDNNKRPYLITRRYVKEKYFDWQPVPGHPLWDARIAGQFPSASEDTLYPLSWIENAKNSQLSVPASACKARAGVDVSGPGSDETTVCVRRGPRVILQKAFSSSDSRGECVACLLPFKEANDLEMVCTDAIGLGYYFHKHLLDLGFPSVGINITERARDQKFDSLKSEVHWQLRERLSNGTISGPLDDKTVGQLSSIHYFYNSKGQIEIESKTSLKARGCHSPDRAEALILAFAEVGQMASIFAEQFSESMLYDPTAMEPGFGNVGSYKGRYISVYYSAAGATCLVEILDGGGCWYVTDEFYHDPAVSPGKSDAILAQDLIRFRDRDNPATGTPFIRNNPDVTVIVPEAAENFTAELRSRGLWCQTADENQEGIQMVASVMERNMLRVNKEAVNIVSQFRSFSWDRTKAQRGESVPLAGTGQACLALSYYFKTVVHPYRVFR